MPDIAVSSVYQPITDLLDGSLVAVEALVRGQPGPLELPHQLFAAAAVAGTSDELDEACLLSALEGTRDLGQPATVFVNIEPTTLSRLSARRLAGLQQLTPPGLQVVLEITERDLLEHPAELVRSVDRVREAGWGVALDDVGAEPAGLAMLPFLRPDVVKLDLALIRGRTTRQTASVVNAVRAEAERSGAVVLAEGIEDEWHVERALAVGATLGQGWFLGRPGPLDARGMTPLTIDPAGPGRDPHVRGGSTSPYDLLSARHAPKRAGAPLLAAMTRQLEHQALLMDEHTVVLAGFQHATLMSEPTRRRYESLAAVTALTAVVGPGMPAEPARGVHGTALADDDPLGQDWVVAVVGPHFAVVLAAREVGGAPVDGDQGHPRDTALRRLDYVLTYEREQVLAAAGALLQQIRPRPLPRRRRPVGTLPARTERLVPSVGGPDELSRLLLRAISTATNGIVVADATLPDQPLAYVNQAFLDLTGYEEHEVLGQNCRFLQGPGTDRSQTEWMRREVAAGRPVSTVVLNYRKDGTSFFNEVRVSPVVDADGHLTHFIGNQLDVSGRVERERRTAHLASHDELTGLANRAGVLAHLGAQLRRARRERTGAGVLLLDLDGFKAVNDRLGHAAGDRVLGLAAQRLAAVLRQQDLLGRLGGDEFLVVVGDLPSRHDDGAPSRPSAEDVVRTVEAHLRLSLAPPFQVGGTQVQLRASFGSAVFPADGADAAALVARADAAMYRQKTAD